MESELKSEIAAQAAAWFARLQAESVCGAERTEFSLWLLRSPEHVREYLSVMQAWNELQYADEEKYSREALIREALQDDMAEKVHALPLRRAGAFTGTLPGRRVKPVTVFAAGAAVVLTGAWLAGYWFGPSHLRTSVGEQRSVTLNDGSVVHLNTASRVRVRLGEKRRELYLIEGEARFTAARDAARPFIVRTGNAQVRALGTVFNVRESGDRTAIAVLEGRVEVTPSSRDDGGEVALLSAGERAAVTTDGTILPNEGPPMHRVTQWTERRLVFREEPLAMVAGEVNRYHHEHIVIHDPRLAQLRVSGIFSANDLVSLLDYLRAYHHVRVTRNAKGHYMLAPER